MEQTYCMIKPEIVKAGEQKIGAILAQINAAGFRIVDMAMRTLERATVVDTFFVRSYKIVCSSDSHSRKVDVGRWGTQAATQSSHRGQELVPQGSQASAGAQSASAAQPACPHGTQVSAFTQT